MQFVFVTPLFFWLRRHAVRRKQAVVLALEQAPLSDHFGCLWRVSILGGSLLVSYLIDADCAWVRKKGGILYEKNISRRI